MPIQDHFDHRSSTVTDPAGGGFAVTPSDTADLGQMTRGVMVAVGGNLGVHMRDGSVLVLPGLVPGQIYPVRLRRVLATGTTAGGIVGLV